MKSQLLSRRRFLAASGSVLAAVPLTAAERAPEARVTNELVDCQGHLFFSSDHPWVQPKEILDPLRSLNLPAVTSTAARPQSGSGAAGLSQDLVMRPCMVSFL